MMGGALARSNTSLYVKITSQPIFPLFHDAWQGSCRSCSPAGAAGPGETGHAAAAADPRVRLRTGRWPRARPALMLSLLAFGGHQWCTQMLLFEVLNRLQTFSSRENRGRVHNSNMVACTHSASAAALVSATAEPWPAVSIERDSNHHQEVRARTLGLLSLGFA